MKQHQVDIAIIGSGIGGLCAGALAAQAGHKVLVAEKLPHVGGRFASLQYKGYTIHTGGIGVEMGTEFEKTLEEAGVTYEKSLVDPVQYRIRGKDYPLPKKGGMREILSICADGDEGDRIMGELLHLMTGKKSMPNMTLEQWLLHHKPSNLVLNFFQKNVTGGIAMNLDEATVQDFVNFITTAGGWRNYGLMPEGPSAITGRLAKVIGDKGGEVWTGCRAVEISVEKGIVKGIIVEKDGNKVQISAQAVISNAGAEKTIELAGESNFDVDYLKKVRENVIPLQYIWLHVSADRHLMGPGSLLPLDTKRVFYVIDSTYNCPGHAPEGKRLMQSGSLPTSITRPVDYKKELEMHIEDLRTLFSDFDKHAKILVASCYRGQWPAGRTLPGRALPRKTPIDLLYNVGDSFFHKPGNIGAPGAVESAKLTIEDVMGQIKPG